jgi:hypothetical protein
MYFYRRPHILLYRPTDQAQGVNMQNINDAASLFEPLTREEKKNTSPPLQHQATPSGRMDGFALNKIDLHL